MPPFIFDPVCTIIWKQYAFLTQEKYNSVV